MPTRVLLSLLALTPLLSAPYVFAAEPDQAAADPAAIEFFEKKVRPVLAEHCYQCHSSKSEEPKGGLRLDSRAAMLQGGDSGPALVPSHPDKSRLIEAIGFQSVEIEMPPKGKMPDAAIKDLTTWVTMGAPWPKEDAPAKAADAKKFDLAERQSRHWAWNPVKATEPPKVRRADWPKSAADRFILAELETKGLSPAPPADKRTLLRRVYFDLIGLPPAPADVDGFVNDTSPDAFVKVVDRLLASPQFGERWARHWLDLVRYAESRGHEFDYVAPNASEYRDYVIRAINSDLPYNQFVTEQIAGDLLDKPRMHPSEGFNESILGTGFWYLGEQVHSPVDIRQDEADRFDNMIDVMTKTFTGLTVACARCHDHKFDAISTKDYYALHGFLQSSNYRLARFDSMDHNRQVAKSLWKFRDQARPKLQRALADAWRPAVSRSADYLLAARDAIQAGPKLDPVTTADVVFEDFESGAYSNWEVTGDAFGTAPQTSETIAGYQGRINATGKSFVNSHQNPQRGGQGDKHKGTMTSRPFRIDRNYITLLVGGGSHAGRTCVQLLVDGHLVFEATGRSNNEMFPVRWNVQPHIGREARIRIVDDEEGGWGNIGVDHIVLTDKDEAGRTSSARVEAFSADFRQSIATLAQKHGLDAKLLTQWIVHLIGEARNNDALLHPFAQAMTASSAGDVASIVRPLLGESGGRPSSNSLPKEAEVVIDFAATTPDQWLTDGAAYGPGPVRAGDVRFGTDLARPIARVFEVGSAQIDPTWNKLQLAPGAEIDPGKIASADRPGRTIRTPSLELKPASRLYYQVRGKGSAYVVVDSHTMINGPLHGKLVQPIQGDDGFSWVTANDLAAYAGHRFHVEFHPVEKSDFAIAKVVQSSVTPPAEQRARNAALCLTDPADLSSVESLAKAYQRSMSEILDRLAADSLVSSQNVLDQARLANWMIDHPELLLASNSAIESSFVEQAKPLLDEQAKLVAQIKAESRLAMAMIEGSSKNGQVFIRGSHKTLGEPAPRRFLEALVGPDGITTTSGSGRLELARQITDPARNPFISRVMVNRVWHHLFGRGIVGSVDNFGELGERPTHPLLLDYLADQYVREGWSTKRMIRSLVLSNTYQMSADVKGPRPEIDPDNLLLSRMRVRRLEGEAIRDVMLSLSGRFDSRMYGKSVAVNLTPFMEGRGRPESGPLDGAGRRSLYLAVRRNFLSPMMLAFDTPIPFSTVGRRTVSNVPAQSLILMNDPFAHEQARLWAERALKEKASAEERIAGMYVSAFARPPSAAELAACLAFVRNAGDNEVAAWSDLAHVLFNAKEFIYLH